MFNSTPPIDTVLLRAPRSLALALQEPDRTPLLYKMHSSAVKLFAMLKFFLQYTKLIFYKMCLISLLSTDYLIG